MSNFLHGLGGGLGRGIGRIIGFIVVGILVYFIINLLDLDIKNDILNKVLMLNVNARTITADVTNSIRLPDNSVCGSSSTNGRYCAIATSQVPNVRNVKTTYTGVLQGFEFKASNAWLLNEFATITITAMSTDFRNNNISAYVYNESGNVVSSSFTFISKNQISVTFIPTSTGYYSFYFSSPTKITGDTTYGIKSVVITQNQGDNSDIIDSQNQNTEDIINNNNENTQNMIDKMTDMAYPVCSDGYRHFLVGSDKSYISNNTGRINSNDNYYVSTPIKINGGNSYDLNIVDASGIQYGYYCFYNKFNQVTSCTKYTDNSTTNYTFTAPADAYYVQFTLKRSNNVMLNSYLKGNTCVPSDYESSLNQFKELLQNVETNDLIKDDSIDQSQANSFFSDFNDNDHGLSGIITLPLTTIQSLTSSSCVALELPVPFTTEHFTLPCMSQIYQSKAPGLYNMWQVVCYGLIGYWIATDIFKLVKGFKDPEQDKVEVLDL